jgi:hypothetical protein
MQQGWLINQDAAPDRLAKYFNALGPLTDIVATVYDCRSSRLSSGFGCINNSHSGKANEDVGAPAELGYPNSKCPNVKI